VGPDPRGQHGVVDVAEGVEDARDVLLVLGQELDELGVGRLGGDRDRVGDVAQVRHVRLAQVDAVGGERGRRQRERAALAEAAHPDAVGIDPVVGCSGLDAAHGVDVETAVVVGVAVEDPARHHARRLRPGGRPGAGVARVARPPASALRARVDDELREAGAGVEHVLRGMAAAAAVADEGDAAGEPVAAGRADEPAPHRVAARAGEADVGDLHVSVEVRAVGLEDGRPGLRAGVGERLAPVRVQVVRRGHRGAVCAQLLQRCVEVRHV
jgi:hypothetical protein